MAPAGIFLSGVLEAAGKARLCLKVNHSNRHRLEVALCRSRHRQIRTLLLAKEVCPATKWSAVE
jgi:hypothetical protein